MKVSDKLKQAEDSKQPYFSFEYFPPKTEQGLANLYDRIERMARLGPVFVAVTWGAGGATAQRTLELCSACQGVFGVETVMHLTCTNMDIAQVDAALEGAKAAGIQNILALRGDPPRDAEYWTACEGGFSHAVDLVRYIREKYGSYFCVGVAGYPEGHIESTDADQDFEYFVAKVKAGADFVVSQLAYDANVFIQWEKKVRARGITVPVVAGVLPVQSYQSFRRLVFLTKVAVPEALRERLEEAKANDQAVKDLGVEHAVAMVRQLQAAGVRGVHLTTLNLENSVQRVLEALGMGEAAMKSTGRALAGQAVTGQAMTSTAERRVWDDFPNGRWGDARSPAFGSADAYGAMLKFDAQGAARVWGRPCTLDDISSLFARYVTGEIASLPWSDEPLRAETERIGAELARVNRLGFWTLASQPALDGVASADATHGWGPRGGYVYQKAFVECFVAGAKFGSFLSRLQSSASRVTYYAANRQGDFLTNAHAGEGTALTWGVFPGRAVVQPTLIDKISFLAWRAEAFQTWREWAAMFAQASQEACFLRETADECWLVNVVDNDYKQADAIWELFQ
ncbi:methylenetetrahydrofolate reductase (NAD(P)H) met13 [Coemansia sp. RSA 921]|nr:methylenetetrahydrofolate reductase (NAD(P)H) met13 [Coemansia sp. RSA 921]KAJ2536301.1 methylenetetrahydrofolate reductase (NAD(P)H) met13 [Coemansia sp. RSA 1935]